MTDVKQSYVFLRLSCRDDRMTCEWGTEKDLNDAFWTLGYNVRIFWQTGKNYETSVRTDDDPAKIRNRFRPNVSYNSKALSPHKATWCHSVTTHSGRMCPTILQRRPYTKLLDVTVLQQKLRASYSLFSYRKLRLFIMFTHSILPKAILILF